MKFRLGGITVCVYSAVDSFNYDCYINNIRLHNFRIIISGREREMVYM